MGVLRYLFSFKGRINRAKYLFWAVFLFALQYAFKYIEWNPVAVFGDTPLAKAFTKTEGGISPAELGALAMLAWPTIAITLKRLHDRNKGAAWVVLYWFGPWLLMGVAQAMSDRWPPPIPAISGQIESLLPFACWVAAALLNLTALVDLGFTLGSEGDNRFGHDPLERD